MVGKGVLLECLESEQVESVLVINRRTLGLQHPKLKEIVRGDFFDLSPIEPQLKGYNACFFCLGVSSAGMTEEQYRSITLDLTLNFARTLLKLNEGMTFIYVSGTGTDSREKSRMMWARVKGRTENELLSMPFRQAYMFRPGLIQPLKGVKSSTRLYAFFYILLTPLFPLIRISPKLLTTSVNVGRAMIHAVLRGYERKILENADINRLAAEK